MSESTKSSYLRFELGEAAFAISVADVREVLPMAQLERPALKPSLIEGFLNLSARSIPVLRLDRILEVKAREPNVDSHLILINRPQAPFILTVDRVREVLTVEDSEIQGVREHLSLSKCLSAQIHIGLEAVQILNIDLLLLEQEKKIVSESTAAQQKRLLETWRAA